MTLSVLLSVPESPPIQELISGINIGPLTERSMIIIIKNYKLGGVKMALRGEKEGEGEKRASRNCCTDDRRPELHSLSAIKVWPDGLLLVVSFFHPADGLVST